MNREEILNQVTDMMAEMFEIEKSAIRSDSKLAEDLDLDSIDAIDMVVKLQEQTGRRLDEEALKGVRTVADVVDLVEKHLQEE